MGGGGAKSTKQIKKQADYQFGLNQRAMQSELEANRANQTGPWGSVTWDKGQDGTWNQTTTLAPEEQQRLDQQRGLLTGLGGVAGGLVGQVGNAIQGPMDYSKFAQGPTGAPGGPQFGQVGQGPQFNTNFGQIDPNQLAQSGNAAAGQFGGASAREYDLQKDLDLSKLSKMPEASEAARQQVIDAMYGQAQSRMDPEFAQQRQQQLDRLYAMGGREGDPMFNEQQGNLGRQQTDARQQALWNAIQGGGAEQSRLFDIGMQSRQQGFNESMGAGNFRNQALMNQFQQGATNAGFANQAGIASAGNATQANIANAQNRQQGLLAGLNYNRQGVQMGNEAMQQGFQNQMAGTGFNNQASQQGFQNQMAQNAEQSRIRNEQIQQALQERGMPLAEMGSVLGMMGSVANPQFSGYATGNLAAPDYMQAQQANAQIKQANNAAMMSGISSMAGAGMMMSDRRMKKNVTRVGTTPGGAPLYQFEYIFGGHGQVGVMADEVPHAAVRIGGIDYVDYSKVK
jgi:hypothetical protein